VKKIIWVLIIPAVLACSKDDQLPEGYLNQQEMVAFLIDLHITQSKVQNLRLPSDSSELVFMIMEKDLLNEYAITDSTFYKSYSWYLDQPDIMYDIYTSIVDTLTLRQSLLRRED
jgi:hypothetical protein